MVLPQNRAAVACRQDSPRRRSAAAELTYLNPIVRQAVEDVVAETGGEDLDPTEVQQSIQKAVKEAVRERVQEIMNEAGDS